MALVVFKRTPVDSGSAGILYRGLRFLHRHGLPTFIDYGLVEFTANIAMFVPFGLFWFILASRGWRWLGPLMGLGLSMLIELTQLVLLPQRFATPYDVIANGLGALVGTVVAWGALWWRRGCRE
ncbi:glycopeptide antibiotics resistance protein [Arthrobacter sp. CAN_A214]|uniref:VanZ family protein n=1 Tax=Arthrobacter sp. CAN_A214 TaxID=2787720 RepID=UPI0018CA1A24